MSVKTDPWRPWLCFACGIIAACMLDDWRTERYGMVLLGALVLVANGLSLLWPVSVSPSPPPGRGEGG